MGGVGSAVYIITKCFHMLCIFRSRLRETDLKHKEVACHGRHGWRGNTHGLGPCVRDPYSFIGIVPAVCGCWRLSVGMA